MRISLDDADLDRAAAKLDAVAPALTGVAGRMTPALSAGAPPAIKGQVDAAVGEARALVLGVATSAPGRARELRNRAIFARAASGNLRISDLKTLSAWEEANMPKVASPHAAEKVKEDNGFLGLGGVADAIGGAASKYGGAALDGTQLGLDALGLIPGLGEPADGINGLIYGLRGDETNAALSFAGMVPFLGWGATGGKWANKLHHAADAGGGAGSAGRRAEPGGKKPETPEKRQKRIERALAKQLPEPSRRHILDGKRSYLPGAKVWKFKGGHRYPGLPGKTLFPRDWTDERISTAVAEIASRHKDLVPLTVPPQKERLLVDTVDGVEIHVFVRANGEVSTAYPPNGPMSKTPVPPPPSPKP